MRALGALAGGACLLAFACAAAPPEPPLERWDHSLAEFHTGLWTIYAATAAIGRDARGRTLADDLNEWVIAPEAHAGLTAARDVAAARAQAGDPRGAEAALGASAVVLRHAAQRLRLVELYWSGKAALDAERERWQRVPAPPAARAASRARLAPLEAAYAASMAPAARDADVDAALAALRRAYNLERLGLARAAGTARLHAGRERSRPCPPPPAVAAAAPAARPARLVPGPIDAAAFYPAGARVAGLWGDVRLRVAIDAAGCAQRAEVLASSGAAELDDAAIEWTEYARFEPALAQGAATAAPLGLRVSFGLGDESVDAPPASARPLTTLGGITLGMTRRALLELKGRPAGTAGGSWVYNSVDARHDGVVTVYFEDGDDDDSCVVRIEYSGNQESEPPGLPPILGFTRAQLDELYGPPLAARTLDAGAESVLYANGLFVGIVRGLSRNYGLVERARAAAQALPSMRAETFALR